MAKNKFSFRIESPETAKALLKYLSAPAVAVVYKAMGMQAGYELTRRALAGHRSESPEALRNTCRRSGGIGHISAAVKFGQP